MNYGRPRFYIFTFPPLGVEGNLRIYGAMALSFEDAQKKLENQYQHEFPESYCVSYGMYDTLFFTNQVPK